MMSPSRVDHAHHFARTAPGGPAQRIDQWPHERLGYEHERPTPAYAGGGVGSGTTTIRLHRAWVEERVGSLIGAAGLLWGAQVVSHLGFRSDALLQTPGPLEVAAVGILIWLHAKWLRSTRG